LLAGDLHPHSIPRVPVFKKSFFTHAMKRAAAKQRNPKAWSGRFSEPVDAFVQRFTASVGFDKRLAGEDIAGSLAHARMLAAQGIIPRRSAPRSRPAASTGASPTRTCTATSSAA
jgi:hypothetical protein